METEIYLFETDGGFFVVTVEHTSSHATRREARATANEMAKRTAPSRVIPEAPAWWTGPAPLEEPVVTDAPAPIPSTPSRTAGGTGTDPALLAGPDVLGRSILLDLDAEVPGPWAGAPEITLSSTAVLSDPATHAAVATAFVERRRTIIRVAPRVSLELDATAPVEEPVWSLDATFVPLDAATVTLATRNAVDARGGHGRFGGRDLALARGATAAAPGDGDVVLEDGTEAWIDGGPLRLTDPVDLDLTEAVVPLASVSVGVLTPLRVDTPTAALAPDQLAAVADAAIPARIIAPAGSGKTRVLVERARHLLHAGVATGTIRVVAFNKRAQLEIEERTADLGPLSVLTINALALSIINGRNGFASRSDRVETIDERQVRTLLSSMVKFPRRANTDPAAAWIDALTSARLGLRSPREVEASFNGDVEGFERFFEDYRRALRERGQVDFDEQIYRAIEILLTEPEVARHAQRTSQVLLVDEFQDLTPAHLLLLRLVAGPTNGIFGVGDDDQTIYGYSGASPTWLVEFDSFVGGAVHHALEVNYRCPAPVVKAASNLLTRNRYRVPKAIVAGPSAVMDASSLRVQRTTSTVDSTLARITELLEGGVAPADIAVLTRVNTLLTPLEAGLRQAGLPVVNRDGVRFFDRTGVAAALAWFDLATIDGPLRAPLIERAARRPSRSISPRVIEWMAEQREVEGLDALANRLSDDRTAEKVRHFAADLAHLRATAATGSADVVLEAIRSELGLDRSMATLDKAHVGRNSAAHSDGLRALVALGRLHPDTSGFTSWLTDVIGQPSDPGGITLATVHKVKGLEWDHVIVHDVSMGVFPHHLSTDVEEERRVFHVALTRARQSLTLVVEQATPSMFVGELDAPGSPAATAPSSPGALRTARSTDHGEAVEAVEGLTFNWGGYDCVVAEVSDAVTVNVGNATMAIAFGSSVTVEGRTRVLAPISSKRAKAAAAVAGSENPAAFEALKAWRLERSRADGVPAYVVAKNDTLLAIAAALPTTEDELLAITGVGPKKVELYGDEILACLDGLSPPL